MATRNISLPAGAELALLDDAGRAVPLQAEVLGTWHDGSAVRAAGNPEHLRLRVLRLAWEEKFRRLLEATPEPGPGQGKSYTASVYGCAEAIGISGQFSN